MLPLTLVEELGQTRCRDLMDPPSNKEAIIQCIQFFALGQFIRCSDLTTKSSSEAGPKANCAADAGYQRPHQADKRDRDSLATVVKHSLVENCQKSIQNGAVGLEDFVYKSYTSVRKVAFDLPDILIFLESPHGQWPKQLLQWLMTT